MHKRMIYLVCLLLLASVLLPAAVLAEQGGEEFRLHGYVTGTLRFESSYLEPHEGPGYKYNRASLKLDSGAKVKVLTQAMDASGNRWVMVEAQEGSHPKRVYLLQKERGGQALIDCDLNKVPMEAQELESTWQCSCYGDNPLRCGPGTEYAKTGFVMNSRENAWVVLTNNGWALVECTNAYDEGVQDVFYFTRGWVDFGNLIY